MTLIFAILALISAIIGLIPMLGILEWIALVLAIIAFITGIIGVFVRKRKGGMVELLAVGIKEPHLEHCQTLVLDYLHAVLTSPLRFERHEPSTSCIGVHIGV